MVLCLSNFGMAGEKFSLEAEVCEQMEHGHPYAFFASCKEIIVAFLIEK